MADAAQPNTLGKALVILVVLGILFYVAFNGYYLYEKKIKFEFKYLLVPPYLEKGKGPLTAISNIPSTPAPPTPQTLAITQAEYNSALQSISATLSALQARSLPAGISQEEGWDNYNTQIEEVDRTLSVMRGLTNPLALDVNDIQTKVESARETLQSWREESGLANTKTDVRSRLRRADADIDNNVLDDAESDLQALRQVILNLPDDDPDKDTLWAERQRLATKGAVTAKAVSDFGNLLREIEAAKDSNELDKIPSLKTQAEALLPTLPKNLRSSFESGLSNAVNTEAQVNEMKLQINERFAALDGTINGKRWPAYERIKTEIEGLIQQLPAGERTAFTTRLTEKVREANIAQGNVDPDEEVKAQIDTGLVEINSLMDDGELDAADDKLEEVQALIVTIRDGDTSDPSYQFRLNEVNNKLVGTRNAVNAFTILLGKLADAEGDEAAALRSEAEVLIPTLPVNKQAEYREQLANPPKKTVKSQGEERDGLGANVYLPIVVGVFVVGFTMLIIRNRRRNADTATEVIFGVDDAAHRKFGELKDAAVELIRVAKPGFRHEGKLITETQAHEWIPLFRGENEDKVNEVIGAVEKVQETARKVYTDLNGLVKKLEGLENQKLLERRDESWR